MVLATGGGIVSEPLTFDLILFVVLYHLAEAESGRTPGAGAGAGRSAPDGGRSLGHGRAAYHPAEPRAAVMPGRLR